ncbi:MAG: enediyne biosynthesis protein, partial [Verrucomicrobiota bacterium]|nr:enediyne biosynthesis protein [Verrucomicrobiota bacterium]
NADGWPDLAASRNDQPALAFLHRGLAEHRPLRIVLQGSPGNPTSIGARLTLTLTDGTTRTAEVVAASGYYSQSSSAVFFALPTGPRMLEVRWPDGKTSTHALKTGDSANLVIAP